MADIKQVKDLIRQEMINHDIADWAFHLNTNKTRLGYCNYVRKEVSLSIPWMLMLSLEECHDVILHEIAHALVRLNHDWKEVRPHGKEWKAICTDIGCTPMATYQGSVKIKVQQKRNGLTVTNRERLNNDML